jgi:spartin
MSGGRESPDVVGFGRQAPPSYGSGPGESLDGQRADIKR